MEKRKMMKDNRLRLFQNWLVWVYGLTTLLSTTILVIFWFTNIFRDSILANLELRNDTPTFALWQRPPVRLAYKVYVFNYTNVDEFESGKEKKLRVQEVGPYIYRETFSRVNVVFNSSSTVTYQEKRSYQWEGGRSDDEMIRVPNVPLLSTIAFSRDIPFTMQIALTFFLSTIRSKSFVKVSTGGFLWGYDDNLFEMGKSIMALMQPVPMEKFGMLASRVGVSPDRITIHTGYNDINKVGQIQGLGGKKTRDVWGDKNCDKVGGSDGSVYPANLLRDPKASLHVYAKDLCRTMPLRFHGYGSSFGIPSLRYKVPNDTFSFSHSKNLCYCQKLPDSSSVNSNIVCPRSGLFNISACTFGTPMVVSFPHFYTADKSLVDEIDGLNPQEELHGTYADLHPRLGVPIGGSSRLQINVEVRKANGIPFLSKVKEGTILPLIWVETGIDQFPEPILSVLNHAHFTAAAVETCVQWGSLIFVIFSTAGLLRILSKHRLHGHLMLQRNESGQSKLIKDALQ